MLSLQARRGARLAESGERLVQRRRQESVGPTEDRLDLVVVLTDRVGYLAKPPSDGRLIVRLWKGQPYSEEAVDREGPIPICGSRRGLAERCEACISEQDGAEVVSRVFACDRAEEQEAVQIGRAHV